jgi:flavin-binding protein dodecin
MNELRASTAVLTPPTSADRSVPQVPVEFVGSSDHTIAEAVRRALSRASLSLRTLDGAGVVVIPQIRRGRSGTRFRVTLRVSQSNGAPSRG